MSGVNENNAETQRRGDAEQTGSCDPQRTRIKVCGVFDVEAASHAARCGADFVGLNFVARSPRFVTADRAKEISAALAEAFPSLGRVGLFCNHATAFVKDTAARCGLTAVQLHGDESREDVEKLDGLTVWKAVPCEEERIDAWRDAPATVAALLIDAPTPPGKLTGGGGEVFDWLTLAALDRIALPPIMLAGGLTPNNVREAIRVLKPGGLWGVDVSSGVESSRGIKDPLLIKAFCDAVRAADAAS